MTKAALNKIVLALGCLVLFVVGALMIQELTIKEASADVEEGQPAARSEEASHKNIVASFLTGDDTDPSALASTCFDLHLDTSIPSEFAIEALDPSDFEESFASGNSLSFTYSGSAEAARNHCEKILQTKGWIQQEGSSDLVASYAKPRGAYTWLVLQFIQMGEKTIVLATTIDASTEK